MSGGAEADASEVLLLFPDYITRRVGAGNWKDLQALHRLLLALRIPVRLIALESGGDEPHYSAPKARDAIFYYSRWPGEMRRFRRTRPQVRLHVRAVNAEALQAFHRYCSVFDTAGAAAAAIRKVARRFADDIASCRQADTVLGISEWDNSHYWRYVSGTTPIVHVPYFSPWPELRRSVTPRHWRDRTSTIVCMPGVRDAIGASMVAGFEALHASFRRLGLDASWVFAVTDGVAGATPPETVPDGFQRLQTDDAWGVLCSVRAVAVLGSLGFGVKTTIVDGLAAGCHVLVDATLAKRLPEEVRTKCLVVDAADVRSVERTAIGLREPGHSERLNGTLREKAASALAHALGREAAGLPRRAATRLRVR